MPKPKPSHKRKPAKRPEPDEDAMAFHRVVQAIIDGLGRGGLSYVAAKLGMSASNLHKRLKNPPMFDAATMRAVILVQQTHAKDLDADPAPGAIETGGFLIEIQDGEPRWRPADAAD